MGGPMAMQSFKVPPSIVFGEESLKHLGTIEGKRAMIVTGGSSMKRFGFIDQTIEILKGNGIESQVFDGA